MASDKQLRIDIENAVVEDVTDSGIRKTDKVDSLVCYCSDNPPMSRFEQQIRGYIFDNDNLILKSLPYATEFKYDEDSIDEDLFNVTNDPDRIGSLDQYNITVMKEGTSIRVFFYNNSWYITTHRKINAFNSKWGKESFGQIFENNIKIKTGKSLDEFLDTLNKEYSYIFLVGTTLNTRVVSPQYDDVHLLTCMDKNNEIVIDSNMNDYYIESLKFSNIDEAIKYVSELKFPFANYGIFLYSKKESFKIINSEYNKLSKLRHNLPSIMFAYLYNVFNEKTRLIFRDLYSYMTEDFDKYDKEIELIADDILKKYFNRFVKKETFNVSKHEHHILYSLHGLFLKNRVPITKEHVMEIFRDTLPSNINKIINERKQKRKADLKKLEADIDLILGLNKPKKIVGWIQVKNLKTRETTRFENCNLEDRMKYRYTRDPNTNKFPILEIEYFLKVPILCDTNRKMYEGCIYDTVYDCEKNYTMTKQSYQHDSVNIYKTSIDFDFNKCYWEFYDEDLENDDNEMELDVFMCINK